MIKNVGVVGAGTMGIGLAQSLAENGYRVVLVDIVAQALVSARNEILQSLHLRSLLDAATSDMEPGNVIENIHFTTDFSLLADVDFLIENVTENVEVKREVYQKLDRICSAECIFGVNTSAIPISKIAATTQRPSQVIGMHFMNPVPMMPLVEVIPAASTSEKTLQRTQTLLREMGKEWVIVGDSSGFVTNRVMMLTVNEAIFLLYEKVSRAPDIDKLFKKCFGHKMGPLETVDLIGLDTVLFSLEVLCAHLENKKYEPCPLLREMVDAGLLGRKSGRGFYSYC
jgi:3-hydroxybutyryl-CoA dehydrogenase